MLFEHIWPALWGLLGRPRRRVAVLKLSRHFLVVVALDPAALLEGIPPGLALAENATHELVHFIIIMEDFRASLDPDLVRKNWYLRRGLNLYNVLRHAKESLTKNSVVYSEQFGLRIAFSAAIQGMLRQYNPQTGPSCFSERNTCNTVCDVRLLDPDTLYINRRMVEDQSDRNSFQEILINRNTRRADLYLRKWGIREIYEH